jgi:hypothetical protein
MIPDIPWYITAIVLGVIVAIAVALWRIVATATTSRQVRAGSALFLFGWLGAALLLALALARGAAGSRALAVGWNVVGLLDLVVAVGMATGYLAPLLAPRLGAQVPPAPAMGVFPLILVPTFAVPVSIMLHLLGLIRLTGESRIGVQPMARAVG